MGWANRSSRIVERIDDRVDELRRGSGRRAGARIEAYRGHGTAHEIFVAGRVRSDPAPTAAKEGQAWWQNLMHTYRRMESDEVAAARVEIQFAGVSQIAIADNEGYFRAWLRPLEPLSERLWHDAEMILRDPPSPGATKAEIMTPLPGTKFGVISDLDDTVIQTDVTRPVRMFRSILLGNARTRLPFDGVAEFYRALHAGPTGAEANPIFYVSSSPWNFYDLLVEFLELNGIPRGPLFLRDWGVSEDAILPTDHRGHKFAQIRQILATYPLPFILIGDSGQRDPEIYREVVAEYPNRILAIYIRSVTANPLRHERIRALAEEVRVAGSALVLSEDTHGAVRHAVEQGWIVGKG